jgi:hypothetical protein
MTLFMIAAAFAFALVSGCSSSSNAPQAVPTPENSAKDAKNWKSRPKPPPK